MYGKNEKIKCVMIFRGGKYSTWNPTSFLIDNEHIINKIVNLLPNGLCLGKIQIFSAIYVSATQENFTGKLL